MCPVSRTSDCPEAQGAGSNITSVNDYIKWAKAVMNCESSITEEIYKVLIQLRTVQNPSFEDLPSMTSSVAYAAGWEVYYYRGYMVVSHHGAVSGFGSCHSFLPEIKFSVVILGNPDDGGTLAFIMMREFIDEILQVPEIERPDWNQFVSEDHSDRESEYEKLRQKLCPGIKE